MTKETLYVNKDRLVLKSRKAHGGYYIVTSPDVTGLHTYASTRDEGINSGVQLLTLYRYKEREMRRIKK